MAGLSPTLEDLGTERLEHIDSRLTTSRRIILGILESARKPMTVTDIAKRSNDLVQSSLYRNLTVLENAGLVVRIVNDNDFAFFELDEHVLGHHHHLRCIECGDVIDIELTDDIEKLLEKTARSIGKKYGYARVEHHLDFSGICSNCQ